ncbi:hypothetical protein QFC21_002561 [Naganishia friedmannii]|uniref:Uncharacterized protein n=1 Tax=Naganishia friedmannii TaxID=89922 RepID=A0ACC2VVV8_9TREE|nr:hypothetical protein QFC21_002561 [Naganishia friedmannii]
MDSLLSTQSPKKRGQKTKAGSYPDHLRNVTSAIQTLSEAVIGERHEDAEGSASEPWNKDRSQSFELLLTVLQTVMKAKPKQHPLDYKGQDKRNDEIFSEYSNWINGLGEATKLYEELDLASLLLAKSRTTKLFQLICDFQQAFVAWQSYIIAVTTGYWSQWLVRRNRVTELRDRAKATERVTSALFELCRAEQVRLATSIRPRGQARKQKEAVLDDWTDDLTSSAGESEGEGEPDDLTRNGGSNASDTIHGSGTAEVQSTLALRNLSSNQTDVGMRLAYSKVHSDSLNTT